MGARPHRPLCATLALAAVALCACGKGGGERQQAAGGGPAPKLAPVLAPGAVSVATRNTTRLGGADAVVDAAAVARAVYPGLTAATRPQAVVIVDRRDWAAALSASALASAPASAPILFAEGDSLPAVTRQTLEAMRPLGAPALGGAQVIEIDTRAALPGGDSVRAVRARAGADTAAAVARLLLALDRAGAPRQAIAVPEDAPASLAMPAAGLAAESGAPIVMIGAAGAPAATAAALAALRRPTIYVVDAPALGRRALEDLRRYGRVRQIPRGRAAPGEQAVQGAIEVARFTEGAFGWGVKEPGHGLVLANASRPLDAPASALLAATGDYGPLLLLTSATRVPPALARYLSDIQPAYAEPRYPPVRGAYNHGWLIGDERAIAAVTQAEIDSLLEIVPRAHGSEEQGSEEEEASETQLE